MIQVSAAVRLIPRPPALVHSRKTKRSESGLLKRSMAACRRFPRTRPSIRSYKYLSEKEDSTIMDVFDDVKNKKSVLTFPAFLFKTSLSATLLPCPSLGDPPGMKPYM